jgi:hypothetical protein
MVVAGVTVFNNETRIRESNKMPVPHRHNDRRHDAAILHGRIGLWIAFLLRFGLHDDQEFFKLNGLVHIEHFNNVSIAVGYKPFGFDVV